MDDVSYDSGGPDSISKAQQDEWLKSHEIESSDKSVVQQVADVVETAATVARAVVPGFENLENAVSSLGQGKVSDAAQYAVTAVAEAGTATMTGALAAKAATALGAKQAAKAAATSASKAAEAAGSEGKSIVLGEGMGRVKDAAKALQADGVNAKWYQAWSKNFPTDRAMTPSELSAALARNEKWLTSKIKEGYQIFDIGIDATRATRSPFYQLEQSILQKFNYPVTPFVK